MTGNRKFEMVPPPQKAPVQKRAEELGLIPGLHVSTADGKFRCSRCEHLKDDESVMVWVPRGISPQATGSDVEEACRVHALNGHLSAWCLPCAKALGTTSSTSSSVDNDIPQLLVTILVVLLLGPLIALLVSAL